ncbi:hypothetical protein [Natronosalvus halobius]|nr:hypothetical protein [Natronosalvus halobius]
MNRRQDTEPGQNRDLVSVDLERSRSIDDEAFVETKQSVRTLLR